MEKNPNFIVEKRTKFWGKKSLVLVVDKKKYL